MNIGHSDLDDLTIILTINQQIRYNSLYLDSLQQLLYNYKLALINMKNIIILIFLTIISGCSAVPHKINKETYEQSKESALNQLNAINTENGINYQEAQLIFTVYNYICSKFPLSTVSTYPIEYDGVYLSQISTGDRAHIPTKKAIILEAESGKMYSNEAQEYNHELYSIVINNCNKTANKPVKPDS